MAKDTVLIFFGDGTEDCMIKLPLEDDAYSFLRDEYLWDDAGPASSDAAKLAGMREKFAGVARAIGATAILLGSCYDHIPVVRLATARYFLENVENLKVVFTFSIHRTTATWGERGAFDLLVFKFHADNPYFVGKIEGIDAATVWPSVLKEIEKQLSLQPA